MKKYLLTVMLFLTVQTLTAAELVYPNGKKENYTPLKINRTTVTTAKSYLRKKRIFRDTRTLYISFGKRKIDTGVIQKYHLKLLKITNPSFHTALFQVQDERDIVALCTDINLHEKVRFARPNWRSLRGLH